MKNLLSLTTAFALAVCLAGSSFAADKNSNQSTQPASKTAASTQPSATKAAHDGGINDIDAIGNRNVGCARGMGNWYSLESEIRMGKEYAQQVDQSPVTEHSS